MPALASRSGLAGLPLTATPSDVRPPHSLGTPSILMVLASIRSARRADCAAAAAGAARMARPKIAGMARRRRREVAGGGIGEGLDGGSGEIVRGMLHGPRRGPDRGLPGARGWIAAGPVRPLRDNSSWH